MEHYAVGIFLVLIVFAVILTSKGEDPEERREGVFDIEYWDETIKVWVKATGKDIGKDMIEIMSGPDKGSWTHKTNQRKDEG